MKFGAFLLFPILGSVITLLFRPSELDPYTFERLKRVPVAKETLELPNGQRIRFLGIPSPEGTMAFFLSEREIAESIWNMGEGGKITYDKAQAFCVLLSEQTGRTLRLPRRVEWQMAARGGLPNAETPWGYGLHTPPKGIHFALEAPPSRPGPALGYGFRDMAGGRWEWTAEGDLIGGAWSETNLQVLHLAHIYVPPKGYGDDDTGLRILLEPQPDI